MYSFKRMIWYGFMAVIGIALIVLSACKVLPEFWCGFGGGIAGVAVVRLALGIRYRKNEDYANRVDLSVSDERNRYLSDKAKGWAFYLSIVVLALLCIVLKIIWLSRYAAFSGYILCGMLLIYWIAYIILNRKY